MTDSSVEIFTLSGAPVERATFEVDWSAEAIELCCYEDFMLKEIHEQPAALRPTRVGRLDVEGAVDLSELDLDLAGVERVVVVACGTAYHTGLLGKYAIERLSRLPVEVAVASEYRYAEPVGDENTLVVAISQSGETTDTLAAIEAARAFGGRVLAVTNTQGSLTPVKPTRSSLPRPAWRSGSPPRRPSSPRSRRFTFWRSSWPGPRASVLRRSCERSGASSAECRRGPRRRGGSWRAGPERLSRSLRGHVARSFWGAGSLSRRRLRGR